MSAVNALQGQLAEKEKEKNLRLEQEKERRRLQVDSSGISLSFFLQIQYNEISLGMITMLLFWCV